MTADPYHGPDKQHPGHLRLIGGPDVLWSFRNIFQVQNLIYTCGYLRLASRPNPTSIPLLSPCTHPLPELRPGSQGKNRRSVLEISKARSSRPLTAWPTTSTPRGHSLPARHRMLREDSRDVPCSVSVTEQFPYTTQVFPRTLSQTHTHSGLGLVRFTNANKHPLVIRAI